MVGGGQIGDHWWQPDLPMHWRSERWVLGVCRSVMTEGWVHDLGGGARTSVRERMSCVWCEGDGGAWPQLSLESTNEECV